MPPRKLLRHMLDAAIAAAQPERRLVAVLRRLVPDFSGPLVVIGAGKASAAMAQVVERHWSGPLSGLVVTRYGYAVQCQRIDIVEASHPVPDMAGLRAAEKMLDLVRPLQADATVLCLMSGGGSALLPLPVPELSLDDKQALSRTLLASGASISQINTVRRHLSLIKGGRLAAACFPARLITLAISDVPGDAPHDIASGPTVADPSDCAEALNILQRYGQLAPTGLLAKLSLALSESIKPNDPRLERSEFHLIATPQQSLSAAAEVARAAGFSPCILSDRIEGEASEVAKTLAAIGLQVAHHGQPVAAPCVLLSGGETTVTVRAQGRGGRNVEFLLALGLALQGHPDIHALAADTDGVDGQEDIAGAYLDPSTLERAWALGISPAVSLANNDAHSFFQALGDSVITGPTLTNVNDFRALLITR